MLFFEHTCAFFSSTPVLPYATLSENALACELSWAPATHPKCHPPRGALVDGLSHRVGSCGGALAQRGLWWRGSRTRAFAGLLQGSCRLLQILSVSEKLTNVR